VPGDAGRTAVLNRAYAEAEASLAAAAGTRDMIEQAASHAEHVLRSLFKTAGWNLIVRWSD
jgi:hypothetical protein